MRRVSMPSRNNRAIAVAIWALSAAIGIASAVQGSWAIVPALAFASLAAWVALWRPAIEVDDEAATVRNVLRTVRVPWPALTHVSTRYALTLHTPHGDVSVFSAPQPGRFASFRARRSIRRAGGETDGVRPGDLLGTESGDAAALVRDRWQRLVEGGRMEAGVADSTELVRTTNVLSLALLSVGAAVALGITALVA